MQGNSSVHGVCPSTNALCTPLHVLNEAAHICVNGTRPVFVCAVPPLLAGARKHCSILLSCTSCMQKSLGKGAKPNIFCLCLRHMIRDSCAGFPLTALLPHSITMARLRRSLTVSEGWAPTSNHFLMAGALRFVSFFNGS